MSTFNIHKYFSCMVYKTGCHSELKLDANRSVFIWVGSQIKCIPDYPNGLNLNEKPTVQKIKIFG